MRLSTLWGPSALDLPPALRLGLLLSCAASFANAITFKPIPPANLNLESLGRTGFGGDFNGISLYQFEGQTENGLSTNGSQSVMGRFPNGVLANLASSDASIQTMCSILAPNGTFFGVIVGGNFTSLGGIESPGVALFNPNTSGVVPLPGLSGQVSALLCDQARNTVYVGGSFKAKRSTNAIAWVGTDGWTDLPFYGFNGPVTSISKAPDGHIIFGGSFTGLGNTTGPILPDQQVINLSSANLTAGSSATVAGFSDPANIVCKAGSADGPGNTWLLADNTPGFWKASFGFGFRPTKLRLRNTRQEGRGTKTFRYTALPINGIMNFTYIDPATGRNLSCSSDCPLSNNATVAFQDFHFVDVIGMNGFQIDVSAWYDNGGGLNGIELFQDDIFSYAIKSNNEPTCANTVSTSGANPTGPWIVSPSFQSTSQYLKSTVNNPDSASVVFLPDIKQSGNYSVNMYTPGCIQDGTCANRGRVNVTGNMASGTNQAGFSTEIFQTNNFDKYDQIYFGFIEASSSSFRPSVTMKASSGQDTENLTIVAQRVGFSLISPSGGLNSLFDFDPTKVEIDIANLGTSVFDAAGMSLPPRAGVNALQTSGSTTFVGGNFSTNTLNNIFAVTPAGTLPLAGNGLNGEVETMLIDATTLYIGGTFTSTSDSGSVGLLNIAAYDIAQNTWSALGAGVNGPVTSIVPLQMNISANKPETTIAVTGDFTQIQGIGRDPPSNLANGFAIWVPSRKNWLSNLNVATTRVEGELTASIVFPDGGSLFAGSLSSSELATNYAAELLTAGDSLRPFPVRVQASSPQFSTPLRNGAFDQNSTGIITGLFHVTSKYNLTILGGHFTTKASDGSDVNNLVLIDGKKSDAVSGVGSSISIDSVVLALAVQAETLYVGGSLSGTVNGDSVRGLISYNLDSSSFGTQPPSLNGDVQTITTSQTTNDIYVGGSFSSAGSLSCPAVCMFSASASQWNRPGSELGGTAIVMSWVSTSSLIVGGALTLTERNVSLATFDTKSQNWTAVTGSDVIPGPVSSIAKANSDASQFWVSGLAPNGSSFLMKYDGTAWNAVSHLLGSGTQVKGIQVLSVSSNHAPSSLVSAGQILLVTGALSLPGFGNASAALFNGTAFRPYILTSAPDGTGGSLSQFFVEKENFFQTASGRLARGFVVLIALAIALSLVMLIIVAGLFAERLRRKREGYSAAPTTRHDRGNGMTSHVPPAELFRSIGQGGRKVTTLI